MTTATRKCLIVAAITALSFFGYGFQTIPILSWLNLALTIQLFRYEEPGIPFTIINLLAASISVGFGAAGFYSPAGPVLSRLIVSVFAFIQHSILVACMKVESIHKSRFKGWSYSLVFPVLFTSANFLWTRFSPFGSAGHLAYTQAGETSIVQLASLWGIHGILFLMCVVASFAVESLQKPQEENLVEETKNTQPRRFYHQSYGVWMLLILFSAMIYGGARTNLTNDTFYQQPMDTLSIRKPHEIFCYAKVFTNETPDEIVGEFETIVKENPKTKMIVTAENAFAASWYWNRRLEVRDGLQNVSDTNGVYIVVAIGDGRNSLTALLPNKPNVPYHKHNLIPFFETYDNPSNGKMAYFDSPEFGRIGLVVCFDADFPSYIHQASELGVDLLIQAAQTYGPLRFVHAGFAKFRAVEQGLTVLRCCRDGVTGIYDPFYRTLQEEETFKPAHKDTIKVNWSRRDRVWTLYGACGDLLGWVSCFVSFAIILTAAFIPKTWLRKIGDKYCKD